MSTSEEVGGYGIDLSQAVIISSSPDAIELAAHGGSLPLDVVVYSRILDMNDPDPDLSRDHLPYFVENRTLWVAVAPIARNLTALGIDASFDTDPSKSNL